MILDQIIEKRKIQLEREKQNLPFAVLKESALSERRRSRSFFYALKKDTLSVIAEVKKASPSKGIIQPAFDPVKTAKAYEAAGVNAVSVLTEEFYFEGSSQYLKEIRQNVKLPVLRKDFIFDQYQIYESKVIGADAILLIAAILDTDRIIEFETTARELGLECLVEVHNNEELEKALAAKSRIIGINNRDLKTFKVDLQTTAGLIGNIPKSCAVVSESGIQANSDMKYLREQGADGVLIGETLMKSKDVSKTLRELRGKV